MRQGAARTTLAERGDDLYETPAWCTQALLRWGVLERHDGLGAIWEPCAGKGAISRELRASGREVVAQDLVDWPGRDAGIETGCDFLMSWSVPRGVTCIVTNPPYKLADEMIWRGLRLGLPLIMFLRLMSLEGERRAPLISGYLHEVWFGHERPPSLYADGRGGSWNAGAPFGWFVFRPGRREGPIALHPKSWGGS